MKKNFPISFFLFVLLVFFACTPDENTPLVDVVVKEVLPLQVKIGSIITIRGTNFDKVTGAKIGAELVGKNSFYSITSEEIILEIPTGVTFPCTVTLFAGKYQIVWDGQLTEKVSDPVQDAKYTFEPKTPSIQHFTFSWSSTQQIQNIGDYYKVGQHIISVYIHNSQDYMQLTLIVPVGTYTFIPSGVYSIVPIIKNGDITPNKAWASPGNNSNNEPNPSYIAKRYGGGYQIFYLIEGTVTILNAGMLNINAASYFGSTVTASYTGNLQIN